MEHVARPGPPAAALLQWQLQLFSGPEGPEPALGSLGAACSVVMREVHYNTGLVWRRGRVAPVRRAVRSRQVLRLTDDLVLYLEAAGPLEFNVLSGRAACECEH